MDKFDFKKAYKEFYAPTAKAFSIVRVPKLKFVMIDGQGSPDGEAYSRSVQWLYATVYPIKFIAKAKLGKDFVAPPLEGRWWADDMSAYINDQRDEWKWQMMIALPDWVHEALFAEGVAKAEAKLGQIPASLRTEDFEEGLSVQIMHVGPYSDEGPTIAKLHNDYLPAQKLEPTGRHHEIYLNDPRRTAPEKLKTVLRQPVRAL